MPRPEPDGLTGILQMDTDTSENLAGFVNFNQHATTRKGAWRRGEGHRQAMRLEALEVEIALAVC
jgi:hypothetical protein